MTLENEKVGTIICKDGGSTEDVKSRIAKARAVLSQLEKVWKNRKISLQTKITIFDANMALKHGLDDLLDVFERNCYGLFWVNTD